MKADELMIGDLVTAHGNPIHVCGIFDSRIYGDNGCDVREAAVHAIPLTREILEKNGFIGVRHQGDSGIEETTEWVVSGLRIVEFTEDWKDHRFAIEGTPIDMYYVHEFQHLLRLCGLAELSDNFKVE